MSPTKSRDWRWALAAMWVAGVLTGCNEPLRSGPEYGPCYPPSPHTPRVQYLRSLTGGNDFCEAGGGFWRALFGGSGEARGDLVKPHGLAAADGRLYVCDTSRGDIFVFDFARGSFDRWEHPDLALVKPLTVRVTDTGEVQVCDVGLKAVVRFSADGSLLGMIDLAALQAGGSAASLPEAFMPIGLANGPGSATAVLNRAAHRVELIDLATATHVGHWSGAGSGAGELYVPTAMDQQANGTLWIADRMNRHVVALGPDGRTVASFGEAGDQPGYLDQPRGLAVDAHGVIYVTDAGLPGVQLFDGNGEYLMGFGYPGEADSPVRLPAGICLDRSCLPYFADLLRPGFEAEYLIFVTDQLGPGRVHVYAFGRGAVVAPEEDAAGARRPG